MQAVPPKGSYHNYCRNNHRARSLQRDHLRSIRTRAEKRTSNLEEFKDFETYLRFLQGKQQQQMHIQTRPNTTNFRSAITSRPRTQVVTGQGQRTAREPTARQVQGLIQPYFPFFKCRIEPADRTERPSTGEFRVNRLKFKLNYRIIEENMGKGQMR